jgi:hypothetical protein
LIADFHHQHFIWWWSNCQKSPPPLQMYSWSRRLILHHNQHYKRNCVHSSPPWHQRQQWRGATIWEERKILDVKGFLFLLIYS